MREVTLAGIYIETPYEKTPLFGAGSNKPYAYFDRDETWNDKWLENVLFSIYNTFPDSIFLQEDHPNNPANSYSTTPIYKSVPIKFFFKSKKFSAEDEVLIKRLRKILINIFSKYKIDITVNIVREHYDDSISEPYDSQTSPFTFNPTVPLDESTIAEAPYYEQTYYTTVYSGTDSNVLSLVPYSLTIDADRDDDFMGKPYKFTIDIEGELYTIINQILINLRAIHPYLR